jgi:hypothetical protein
MLKRPFPQTNQHATLMKNMVFRFQFYFLLIIFISTVSVNPVSGQDIVEEMNANDSIVSNSWILGIGINIVDDSGDNGLSLGSVGDS